MFGIIFGTILIQGMQHSNDVKRIRHVNEFGTAYISISDDIVFLSRHGINPDKYILPHLINHKANLKAMKDIGVTEIVSVNSTGSLKLSLQPGKIVIPDDFIMLSPYPSIYINKPVHITPVLDEDIRKECIKSASDVEQEVLDGGIYWQTTGPRLETKAEIRLMSQFADIVGMTMASEAIIAMELGLQYAAICSVDNYAHGIEETELTIAEITSHGRINEKKIVTILKNIVKERIKLKST